MANKCRIEASGEGRGVLFANVQAALRSRRAYLEEGGGVHLVSVCRQANGVLRFNPLYRCYLDHSKGRIRCGSIPGARKRKPVTYRLAGARRRRRR